MCLALSDWDSVRMRWGGGAQLYQLVPNVEILHAFFQRFFEARLHGEDGGLRHVSVRAYAREHVIRTWYIELTSPNTTAAVQQLCGILQRKLP